MNRSQLIDSCLQAVGGDQPWVDRIDLDPLGHAALGQHLGEVQQRRIDRAADRELGIAGAATDADDVDDGARRADQMRPGGSGATDRAEELQREAILPVCFAELQEVTATGGAGVVDQQVDGAEPLDRKIDQPLWCLGITQIGRKDHRLAVAGGGDLLQRLRRTGRQYQLHSFSGELFGNGAPDATAGAGDDGHLAGEMQLHVGLAESVSGGCVSRCRRPAAAARVDARSPCHPR